MENKNGEYLYFKIYSQLKQELVDGVYKVGDAFPPERALKERFSTTHITVRNALSRLVEEGYIERFSGRGTFVTYTGAEGIKEKVETSVTAVHLVAGSFDYFFTSILDRVEPEMRKAGIKLEVHAHRDDPVLVRAVSKDLSLQKECVSIYFFLETEITPGIAEVLPVNSVLLVPGEADTSLPQIICDIASGCWHASRYLSESDDIQPAYIGDKPSFADRHKIEGFSRIIEPIVVYSGGTVEGGYQACGKVLTQQPRCRAFFCASDSIAAGVLRFLNEKGFQKDNDYRIAGFGATPLAETLEIPSVDLELEKLSQTVLQNIFNFIQTRKLTATTARIKTTFALR